MPIEKDTPPKHPLFSRTDLWLWSALILLNGLLFVPNLLFLQPAYFFSINLELTFALVLWVAIAGNWQKSAKIWFWGFTLFFIYLALIYKSYASVLTGVYQMQPNFYNDWSFIANGLPFLLDSLDVPAWYYIAFVGGVLLLFALLWLGTRALLVKRADKIGRITQMLAVSLGMLLLVYNGIKLQMNAELPNGVNSLVAEIKQNLGAAQASRQDLDRFLAQNPYATYDYAQYHLAEKPNVYVIFFESYGSVLYNRDHFRPDYLEMAANFEARLTAQGWNAVSAFSESPTWGGGSWMAYTSALFGVEINEQSQYKALRAQYAQAPYPNMGRYFHNQGYEYIWVVPINRPLPPEYEADDHAFYGADRWITYDTLNYAGPLYGWGPSAPDQYTFGFIQEMLQQQKQPTFLFFLTQDSHYPWMPLPERVDDWHSLATSADTGRSLSDQEKKKISYLAARENYLAAIDFSFETIGDFITSLDDPNAIIVLVGDHQPPTVSNQDDGFATMMHIISRDDAFLENFKAYGFESGLILENRTPQLAHEGFYSLFMRSFLARYGSDLNNLPPYLEDGLTQ